MKRDEVIALGLMALELSRIGMREPLDIYPYAREPYYKFLYLMMATGRFKVAVELGSFMGVGALHLALGNPRAMVHTIDRDPTTWAVDLRAYAISNIRTLKGETGDLVGPAWIPGPVDLLFVDADHSYAAVRADYHRWLPYMAPGGVVLFDDRHWEGDTRFWDELVAEHGDRAIVLDDLHWSGFGAVVLP